MASDFEIARTTGRCAITDRQLGEGEAYYTVLFETDEGFERRDYAADAWESPPEECFCFWKTRMPVKDKKNEPLVINQEVLTHLFLQLDETDSESKQRFRFVLALLLMRKRVLKFDRTVREDETEFWVLRLMRDQSHHRVLNPEMNEEQIERLSAQMTMILTGAPDAMETLEQEPAADEEAGDTVEDESVADNAHDEESEATEATPAEPVSSESEDARADT